MREAPSVSPERPEGSGGAASEEAVQKRYCVACGREEGLEERCLACRHPNRCSRCRSRDHPSEECDLSCPVCGRAGHREFFCPGLPDMEVADWER